jgi:cell division protein FtsA
MIEKHPIIASLDIGTHQTKVVIAEVHASESNPTGTLSIIGVGVAPSRGLRKGVVTNIDQTVQSIEQALKQAESMAGHEIDSVYAIITGSHIEAFNSNGIVAVKNKEVRAEDIERVLDAAKAVAIPPDREVLHVLPQQFIVDGQDGIKDPVGINGVRLEAQVHVITGLVASAENIVKCANRCGLEVNDIVFSGIASGRAVTSFEEQELGVCVLDIGAGTTDIIVFQNGAVVFAAVIPIGGTHITMDIAAGLRTPASAAEEIKCLYGDVFSNLNSSRGNSFDDIIQVPSTGGRDTRAVSKQLLSEIIEARITELLSLVQAKLISAGVIEGLSSGIVLTGGVANQKSIVELAESFFAMPVRIGNPMTAQGLSDLVSDPSFGGSIGLVSYGQVTHSHARSAKRSGFLSNLVKKMGNWVGGK